MAEEGSGETGPLATGEKAVTGDLWQIFAGAGELLADPGAIGDLDPLRELLERQASGQQVVAERRDRPLAVCI